MEKTWSHDFYRETDPAKRLQILKAHAGEGKKPGQKNTETGSGQPDTENTDYRRMNSSNA